MRAFLLAAGEGRRLRPLTASMPKCLVPIEGTPLLAIWLELLERHGVTHALVNTHHHHEQVIDFLASYPTTVVVEVAYEPRLLGSAGTVLANRRFVAAERDFLILYADNLTTIDLAKMIRFHRTRTEPLTIGVAPTDAPSEKGTVIIGPNGQVTEFVEKAARPRSSLASAGIYVANSELFRYLPGTGASAEPLDFGHHVLPGLAPRMAAYHIDEFLADIGTPETYQRAQAGWPGLQPHQQRAAR